MSVRVKVCGITNHADAQCAIDAGASALGFILVPGTPRFVGDSPEAIDALRSVPPFVSRVIVVRSAADVPPEWLALADAVQFYDGPAVSGRRSLRVVRLRSRSDIDPARAVLAGCDGVVLDTWDPAVLGGSGRLGDLDTAAEAVVRLGLPVILAGGLTPENVGDAVRRVRPYAVDVGSGVESSPGCKDRQRVADFISAVAAVGH